MKNELQRQGDTALMRIQSIPKNAKAVELKTARIVLAYGETTGHVHCIHEEAGTYRIKQRNGEVGLVTIAGGHATAMEDSDGNVFIRIEGEVALLHTNGITAPGVEPSQTTDHDGEVFTTGNYGFIQQREFSPEDVRDVRD